MKKLSLLIALALSIGVGCTKKETSSAPTQGTEQQSAAAPVGDEIVIGEVSSLTGDTATYGVSTHNGIQMAVDEINSTGGIKGKKVKLVVYDDQSKPEEAATAMTKLITQDKVLAVLGEVASSRSLAMAPIAQANKIPMISPSSTNFKVTEVGDYIFRVCFIDDFQGVVMAKFAKETLKFNKVAIMRDNKQDYSVGLADVFKAEFVKLGGQIVADETYSSGDKDFKSQLTKIRTQKPEGIFVPGYPLETSLIAIQSKELKITAPLLGGDGWDSPDLVTNAKEWINGAFFSNHYSNEDKAPLIQDFITKFKTKYNVMPDGLAALGYDAAMVLFKAMERSPDFNPTNIRNEIALTKEFPGVTGKISLDEKRNAVKSAVVLKVDKGEFKYQLTVAP